MPYYFYVLRSQKDGNLYKGVALDVKKRLAQHNAGKTKSLKARIPFEMIYLEEFPTREAALNRERWAKTYRGGKELRPLLVEKNLI